MLKKVIRNNTRLCCLLLSLVSINLLSSCGGGAGTSYDPTSVSYLVSEPWGIAGTGIVRIKDNSTNTLTFSEDVQETLQADGTTVNPNDYELVSTISESIDGYGVISAEVVIRVKGTGETATALLRGYEDALIIDLVVNSGTSASGVQVGGSTVTYMPIGNYTYRGYAENFFQFKDGQKTSEKGRFTLTANFGDGTAELIADTGVLAYRDQNLVIDRSKGEFKGSATGTLDTPSGFSNMTNTTIRGTFHGVSANSVTGFAMQESTSGSKFSTYIAGER